MKQVLRDIKRTTDVTTQALATMTQLSVSDIFTVEVGGYSSWETVQKVVRAFNHLSGMQVRVNDIQFLTPSQQIGRGDVERRHTPTPH